MTVDTLVLGYLDNNCYFLSNNNKCLIIDPSDNGNVILNAIENKELLGILITHRHPDHIGALDYILNKTNTKVLDLEEGFHDVGPFKFQVINTPGHTPDSKTFYFYEENIMFTGDFIFRDTIGRTDLPGGDMDVMYESINNIKKFNDCKIMPGHGESTTLNYEKENNIFFKQKTVE